MNTPVLFLIFNRPDTTLRVFKELENIKPKKLYIAADGPRKSKPQEAELCERTRNIATAVNWECEVHTLFRSENLGCRPAVSSAISWFFEQVEEGIILEDDCLPHTSFFKFCETMLERYRNDTRVAHIGGSNFQDGITRGDGDYYFSNLTHVWGWASWRRVWQNYDVNMKMWPQFRDGGYLKYIFPEWRVYKHLTNSFESTFQGRINTWDYQYFFSNLINHGLSVIPNTNLISNIGFSADATHTIKNHPHANLPVYSLNNHNAPSIRCADIEADLHTLNSESPNTMTLLKSVLNSNLKKLVNQKINEGII